MSIIQNQRTVTQILQQANPSTLSRLTEKHDVITKKYDKKFVDISRFFNELDTIYEEREKYSLHWAFRNASDKFNQKLEKLDQIDQREVDKKYQRTTINEENKIDDFSQSIKKEISSASNRYGLLSRLTLAFDIIISVLLILGVTLIAQYVERSLESFILITSFVGVIAMTKVSLDRFWIIPFIDEWGWNKYHNLTHRIEDRTINMVIGKMTHELENHIEQDYINPRWMKHFYY